LLQGDEMRVERRQREVVRGELAGVLAPAEAATGGFLQLRDVGVGELDEPFVRAVLHVVTHPRCGAVDPGGQLVEGRGARRGVRTGARAHGAEPGASFRRLRGASSALPGASFGPRSVASIWRSAPRWSIPGPPYPFRRTQVVIDRMFCTTVVLSGSRSSAPSSRVTSSRYPSSTRNRSLPSGRRCHRSLRRTTSSSMPIEDASLEKNTPPGTSTRHISDTALSKAAVSSEKCRTALQTTAS